MTTRRILSDGLPEDMPDDYYEWITSVREKEAGEFFDSIRKPMWYDDLPEYVDHGDEPIPWEEEPVNPLRTKLLGLDGLRLLPPPKPLVDCLNYDSLAWLSGQPGSFKSFLALDWACRVAHRGETVLYVVAEGASGLAARVDAWVEANRCSPGETLLFLPEAVHVDRGWQGLVDLLRDLRPVLVVLDTQARMTTGMEENGPDMGRYVERVDEARRASGACILSIHHSAKAGAWLRGHSALMGAADTVLSIVRPDEMQAVVEVRNVKQKDAAQAASYWLRPAQQTNGSVTLMECQRPEWWPK